MAEQDTKEVDQATSPSTVAPDDTQDISSIMIKLHSYTEDHDGWFAHAESQFGIRNIVRDKTHYWYICSFLDAGTLSRINQAIKKVDKDAKYKAAKKFLLQMFSRSKWEHVQRILSITELSDKKPAELADFMLRCLGEMDAKFLLMHIFVCAMPSYSPDLLCFYHHRFGTSVRRCQLPCSWKQSGNLHLAPRHQ